MLELVKRMEEKQFGRLGPEESGRGKIVKSWEEEAREEEENIRRRECRSRRGMEKMVG